MAMSSSNEGSTEQHVLVPDRCCYCIPHRLGLYVLALLKLVLSVALLIVIILALFIVFSQSQLLYHVIELMCVAVFIGLVDIFIVLVAIVSICVKNRGTMDMYYRYNVYVFGSLSVLCCIICYLAGSYFLSPVYLTAMQILFCIFISIMKLISCTNIISERAMEACQTTLNDASTEQLRRAPKLCCYCFPRRLGIIFLVLIKLMLSLGLFMILYVKLALFNVFDSLVKFYNIIIWISITLDVVDVVIAIVVIISVYVKNRRIMKIYYMYSICVFGALTFLCCLIVYISTGAVVPLLTFLFIFFWVFMMQIYINHLLKIEVIKLESRE